MRATIHENDCLLMGLQRRFRLARHLCLRVWLYLTAGNVSMRLYIDICFWAFTPLFLKTEKLCVGIIGLTVTEDF